jgi:MOSC domain-containing protein YiiM
MKLIGVNIGQAQPIAAKSGMSGIFKQPTDAPVTVTQSGLQGDAIVDTANHGGVDQAVYIYTVEDYDWWASSVGRTLAPGTFGENLTLAGAESAWWAVGDVFQIGSVVLQITSPRVPCVTLATRMGDPQFVKKFTQAGRPGVYCRVLQEGTLRVGDTIDYRPYDWQTIPDGVRIGVIEMFRFDLARHKSADELRRLLRAPVAIRARDYYEELLAARSSRDKA